jgi:hypothetical protein
LTDIARQKNGTTGLVISHWLSTRFTVEFIGLLEQLYNPVFNITEFGNIKSMAGANGVAPLNLTGTPLIKCLPPDQQPIIAKSRAFIRSIKVITITFA